MKRIIKMQEVEKRRKKCYQKRVYDQLGNKGTTSSIIEDGLDCYVLDDGIHEIAFTKICV